MFSGLFSRELVVGIRAWSPPRDGASRKSSARRSSAPWRKIRLVLGRLASRQRTIALLGGSRRGGYDRRRRRVFGRLPGAAEDQRLSRWPYFILSAVFLVGLVAFDLALVLRPHEMRMQLDRLLKANLKTRVEYKDIQIGGLGEVLIQDAVVFRTQAGAAKAFECREIAVALDWRRFLEGTVEIDRVSLRDPVLYLEWTATGELDLPSIIQTSGTKARSLKIPAVTIDGLAIVAKNAPYMAPGESATLAGIDLTLSPRRSRLFSYAFEGAIDDPIFGRFSVDGSFGEAMLRGNVRRDGFALTREMMTLLDPKLRAALAKLEMEGTMDLYVELNATDFLDTIDVSGSARARDVSIRYEGFPTKVEHLNGVFHFADGRIRPEAVELSVAGGFVSIKKGSVDFSEGFPRWELDGKAAGLYLDRALASAIGEYPDPGPTVHEVLDALSADGFVDVDFNLKHDEPEGRVEVDVLVTFRETELCYAGFLRPDGTRDGYPYPLHKVVGTLHVGNDGCEFFDVRSIDKHPDITASGSVLYGRRGLGYDIQLRGTSIRLDEKIKNCLQPPQRKIYEDYEPDGPVSFALGIKREREDEDTQVDLVVDLLGITAKPKIFPYFLEDVEGRLVFGRPDGVHVEHVEARHGRGVVTVDGVVAMGLDGGKTEYDLLIDGQDILVDADLMAAARVEFPKIVARLEPFQFAGPVTARTHLTTKPEIPNTIHVDMHGVECRIPDYGVHFTNMRGALDVKGDRLTIDEAVMNLRHNELVAAGWFDIGERGHYDLVLRSRELLLDRDFLQRVGERLPAIAALNEMVRVEGKIDAAVTVRKNERGEGAKTEVNALGVSVVGLRHPFVLREVFGALEYSGGELKLEGWTAIVPYGDEDGAPRPMVNLRTGYWREQKGKHIVQLGGLALDGLVLEDRLYPMLGETIGGVLKTLEARGTLGVSADSVIIGDGKTRFQAKLTPRQVVMRPGLDIEWSGGAIIIDEGVVDDAGTEIHAHVEPSQWTLGPFHLTELSAAVVCDKQSMTVTEVSGRVMDGQMNPGSTRLRFDFEGDHAFAATLSLGKAQLSKLVDELGGEGKKVDGVANLQAALTGQMSRDETWVGSASIHVAGRRLYEMPVFAQIFRIFNLDFLTEPNEAQSGIAQCRIERRQVRVQDASITGPGINLIDGEGIIDFDGRCNLVFDIEGITMLDTVPIIGDIITFGRSFLIKSVHLTGPIHDPSASLGNHITDLASPGAPESRTSGGARKRE
jgi:hypothetical protein